MSSTTEHNARIIAVAQARDTTIELMREGARFQTTVRYRITGDARQFGDTVWITPGYNTVADVPVIIAARHACEVDAVTLISIG